MEVKSVGTFPVILLKLATPPLPPQTKLNLEQNGWNWVLFLATTLLGEVGGTTGWTQSRTKKMSLGPESYGIIACKGFFTQSQVLLSSIVVRKAFRLYWDTNEDDDLNGGSTQIFMNIWSSQLCRYFIWNCFNTVSITTATIMSCLINPG